MSFSRKDPRQVSVRSKTRSERGDGGQSSSEVQAEDQQEEAHPARRERKPQRTSRQMNYYSRRLHLIEKFVNILQRLVFLCLGAWTLFHTGNLFDTIVVVAIGFINARWARDILANFLKSRTSEE